MECQNDKPNFTVLRSKWTIAFCFVGLVGSLACVQFNGRLAEKLPVPLAFPPYVP